MHHATHAWAAFRAPTPRGLELIATTLSPELRFLGEAFDRLGREYPSTRDGLSLTERRILPATAADGAAAQEVFVRTATREARPFLGDTWCFDRMDRLAAGRAPLLTIEPNGTPVNPQSRLLLTETGRRVLDGREDQVALNGVDRWVGGCPPQRPRGALALGRGHRVGRRAARSGVDRAVSPKGGLQRPKIGP